MTQAAAPIAAASGVGGASGCASCLASTTRDLRCTSIDGMSIATGQASKQAPHSEEANGSVGLSATPVMNWPVRVKRVKAKTAASDAAVAPSAGRSQALTAMLP